jgi:prepilin-type N-terminal cleavage/methylation domain-containing protein
MINLKRNKKGFTLMELLIVIAIIGLIAAIAAPKMGSTVDDAKRAKFIGNLAALKTSIELFRATNAGMIRNTTAGKKFNVDTAYASAPTITNISGTTKFDIVNPSITSEADWTTKEINESLLISANKKITDEVSSIQDFADIGETFQFTQINGRMGAFAIAVANNNKDYIIYTITGNGTDNVAPNINLNDTVYSSKHNGYVLIKDDMKNPVYKTVEDFWNAQNPTN